MLSEFNISDAEVLDALLNLDTTKAMGSMEFHLLLFKDVLQSSTNLLAIYSI